MKTFILKKPQMFTAKHLVEIFIEIHDDWFTNPLNTFYARREYMLSYLYAWADSVDELGSEDFPDTLSDSSLIYIQGKFEEWLQSEFIEIADIDTLRTKGEDITTFIAKGLFYRLGLQKNSQLFFMDAFSVIREHLEWHYSAMEQDKRLNAENLLAD
jgi:hypothetical protein